MKDESMKVVLKMWENAKRKAPDPELNQFLADCNLAPEDQESFKMFMFGLVTGANMGDKFSIEED